MKNLQWAFGKTTGDPLAKLLLVILTFFVDKNGNCWASIPFLAEECGFSENTARRKLYYLQKKGFISLRPIEGHPHVITIIGYKDDLKKQLGGANHVSTN